jgi:hypothetical protein
MTQLTRRRFFEDSLIAAAVTAAAASSLPNVAAEEEKRSAANDEIQHAVIGCRIRGKVHAAEFGRQAGVNVAYVCDPDLQLAEELADAVKEKSGKRPKVVQDLRKIFDDKTVNTVSIAAPNHWHALAAIWAMQSGKDVYVEKPVSHNIAEGRRMVQAARKTNRICQGGTQNRSSGALKEAAEFLRVGKLGEVKLARTIIYGGRNSIGAKQPCQIPPKCDINLWLGPGTQEPLTRKNLHYDWHWVWDTGNGELGNNGVHVLDIALRIAKHAAAPRRILSFGGRYVIDDVAETPNTHVAVYDYPEIPLLFEHRALPAKPGVNYMDQHGGLRTGVVAHCEGGYVSGLVGATAHDPSGKVIRKFPGDGGATHVKNFFAAVRSRRKAELAAPVETGHLSASLCHYGNISYRVGDPTPGARIADALGAFPAATEIHRELQAHLDVHGVDLNRHPFRLGPWLHLDAIGDSITRLDTQNETALDRARFLLRETQRPPYVIPEQV